MVLVSLSPEVKFESRINFGYSQKNILINISYENEYFEHYGFVDVNGNVWDETFEKVRSNVQRLYYFL